LRDGLPYCFWVLVFSVICETPQASGRPVGEKGSVSIVEPELVKSL
jgi:hypothetical protein